MAKSRKSKSKKELEKEGRTLGIELDRRHNKEDLIAELEKVEEELINEINDEDELITDVTWDTIEEFTTSISKIGLKPDQINIPAEWDLYKSDTKGYRNHLKLEN